MKNKFVIALVALVVLFSVYIIKSKVFDNDHNTGLAKLSFTKPFGNASVDLKINLSGQGLIKAPDYIFNQTNLDELNLSNNAIGGALQSQVGNLKKLKVLDLSRNKFTGVPAEVGQLKNLEILNLSNNQITGLPNELANLSNLKILDLTGNQYSKVDLEKIKAGLPSSVVIRAD